MFDEVFDLRRRFGRESPEFGHVIMCVWSDGHRIQEGESYVETCIIHWNLKTQVRVDDSKKVKRIPQRVSS